jgi:hypothetical protein
MICSLPAIFWEEVALLHGEVLPVGVGAGGGVAGVDRDRAGGAAHGGPVGDVAGEDLLDLALGEVGDGVVLVDDHSHAVEAHDEGLHVDALGGGGGNLGGFGAAGGHADVGGAGGDGGDAGGGALGGDLEGDAGVLGLILFGEHGHEFRAEGVGALDDELLRRGGKRGR